MQSDSTEIALVPVGTAALWMMCLAVGTIGLLIPYPLPRAPLKELAPVQAQLMHVQLMNDASLPPEVGPPVPDELPAPPPPPAENITAPAAPPLVAVAVPNPAIVMARPIQGPTTIVEPRHATPPHSPVAATGPSIPATPRAPARPTHLTFGEGDGNQPAPEYPREARLARQQGTVLIQFTVGEDGRVQSARAVVPSPFPLLNQAALRAVREDWRFSAGAVRTFEVSIQFELKQH